MSLSPEESEEEDEEDEEEEEEFPSGRVVALSRLLLVFGLLASSCVAPAAFSTEGGCEDADDASLLRLPFPPIATPAPADALELASALPWWGLLLPAVVIELLSLLVATASGIVVLFSSLWACSCLALVTATNSDSIFLTSASFCEMAVDALLKFGGPFENIHGLIDFKPLVIGLRLRIGVFLVKIPLFLENSYFK
jgi:hypothetical protein